MATDYRRPVDAVALAHNFRVFADADCAHEPLYAALSRAIADDDATLALLMQAPYSQRRPVLLFASTHDLLLAGHAHPLARFYRSVAPAGAWRDDVGHAAEDFFDFCRSHRDALTRSIAERSTQTNEVGRSAGLRLALSTLDLARPIALIDVGCSAGLNLLVDRYRFAFQLADASTVMAGPAGSSVVIPTVIRSGHPRPARAIPEVARRFGIDRSPLDVPEPRDARWLQACIWPSDSERHERLAGAIALARASALDLRRGDANEMLVDVLAELDRDIRPVVFHSWVVSYFDGEARRRFANIVRAMVVECDGAWISAEGPNVVPGLEAPALPNDADATLREATVWHLTTRDNGVAKSRAIARSHAHCRWIEWLAD
jgi:hypothetical protein